LPAARAVQPGGGAEASARDGEDRQRAAREALAGAEAGMIRQRQTRIRHDDEAREWVYTQIDARTGQLVSQFPDDATLRRRAYLEGLREAADGAPAARRQVTRIA
jgi:hypothetical protein